MTASHDQTDPLRVLMVMPSYYPVVGGMEIQIARQIPFLRELGIEVAVLTRRTPGTSSIEQHEGVEIRRVAIPGGSSLRSISFTLLGTADIIRQRRRIDIIHAHSMMSPTTIATIAGPLLRKPRIVTTHNSYEPERLFRKPLGKQRLKLFSRTTNRFISISSDIRQLLTQNGVPADRIVSIPNGIDTCQITPANAAERTALRASLGLPAEVPIVVSVGRLQPVKQIDILLRAWAAITGGHLVILGDGDQRLALEALASSLNLAGRIDFRGMVSNVVDYLRAADIFVLPSASEGLSVALLEAMAAGLLPIATAIGGTTDLIEDHHSGLLVQPGDVAGLRAALIHALASPSWRTTAGHHARTLTTTTYDLRVVAQQLAALYRDTIPR